MPPTGVPPSPSQSVEDVVASLGDYSVDAYYFISAGIHAAADRVHGSPPSPPVARAKSNARKAESETSSDPAQQMAESSRHVTGRQLCETLREIAIARWGMMASTVLRAWGIKSTRDFGRLVFAFVDAGHWQKQPTDSIEDFTDVYSFREAFDHNYRIPLGEKA